MAEFTLDGCEYAIPWEVMLHYRVAGRDSVSVEEAFSEDIEKYGAPALHLAGLRAREEMTQKEFAKIIGVTQSNLSAMENGRRAIGKYVAKRIAGKFNVDYQRFL